MIRHIPRVEAIDGVVVELDTALRKPFGNLPVAESLLHARWLSRGSIRSNPGNLAPLPPHVVTHREGAFPIAPPEPPLTPKQGMESKVFSSPAGSVLPGFVFDFLRGFFRITNRTYGNITSASNTNEHPERATAFPGSLARIQPWQAPDPARREDRSPFGSHWFHRRLQKQSEHQRSQDECAERQI